jgi:hypothetical protein
MANRFWVGGTANWDGTAGTKWATTSGGAGGASVPTSADDVFFDSASGTVTVTISGTRAAKSVTTTGFTGTLTGAATGLLDLFGNLTLNADVTINRANWNSIRFNSTATLTSAGKTLPNIAVSGTGITVTLADALTLDASSGTTSTGVLFVSNGTFDSANYNITTAGRIEISNNSNTKVLTLGSSTVSALSFNNISTGNFTFNAGTSQINLTSATASLAGAGITFYNVAFTSTATGTRTVSTQNTFNNLSVTAPLSAGVAQVTFDSNQTINGALSTTSTAGNRRVWFRSDTYGVRRTLTVNSAPSLTDADFRDIIVNGTSAPISGTRIGNRGACTGITFDAPKTVYWNLGGSTNWFSNAWASTSGATPNTDNFPLPQDTAIFNNTGAAGTIQVGFAGTALCTVDFSARTSGVTFDFNNAGTCYGSWITGSGITYVGTAILTFEGQGTKTITSAGKTFSCPITIDAYGGTVELADALTLVTNVNLTVTNGTFDTKNYNVTAGALSSSSSNVRTIKLGSSTINCASGVFFNTPTNLTFDAGTSQINLTTGSAGINAPEIVFYNVSNTNNSSNAVITFTGNLIFNNLSFTATAGESGKEITFNNNCTINGTLSCSGGSAVFRHTLRTGTVGTTSTLTCNAVSTLTDVDFRDIVFAGNCISGGNLTGTRLGDCGGNSGVTLDTPKTVYWNLAGTQNWASTGWALSSGGTPAVNNFPLPQDTAVFDDAGNAGTVTINARQNICNINLSGRTSAMTFNTGGVTRTFYGDWTGGSGVTIAGTGTMGFVGRGVKTITSAGKSFTAPIIIESSLITFQLGDAFNSSNSLTLTSGIFDAVIYNVTATTFSSSNNEVRTLKMGSGLWTLSGSGGTPVWNTQTANNLTFLKGTSDILLSNTSTTGRTFNGGGLSYNKLTIGGATGTSTTFIAQNNQFTELASTKTVAHTIDFSSTTQTFGAWTVTGTAGNVVTLTGTGNGHILAGSCTSGIDYLAMGSIGFAATSPAEFYAGANSTGTATAPVYRTAKPADSTRYWVGGTGNWSDTARWSTGSGGASGASVPRSHDDVVFDTLSNLTAYTATVNAVTGGIRCKALTIAGPATGNVTLAGSTAIVGIHGDVTLPATGLTRTYTGAITLSGSTTGKTFTTNGVTLASIITVNGVGCGWTLGSALNTGTSTLIVANGSFNTGNYNLTAGGLLSSGANSRAVTLGSSTVDLSQSSGLSFGAGSGNLNLTFDAGTSQINLSSSAASLTTAPLPQTFYNVSFTSTSITTAPISGLNTFNNLTVVGRVSVGITNITLSANQTINGTLTLSAGTNATCRTFVRSDTIGTTRTLTCNAVSATDVDFRDITIAGSAAPASGTRLGDCKGNSGITFDVAKTVYFRGTGTANWGATTSWSFTSGGSSNATAFPLAQDTAIIPSSPTPYPGNGGVVAINAAYNIGTIDMSARTSNTMTLNFGSGGFTFYGDFINGTGVTLTANATANFSGRNTQTITSAGKSFAGRITIDSPSGNVQLADALTLANTLTLTRGTFDAVTYGVTVGTFSSTGETTRTLNMGSGLWTITGSGNSWIVSSTGLTLNKNTANILLSDISFSSRAFVGGDFSYNKVTLSGNVGATTITFGNNNTFTELASTKTNAFTIALGTNTQRVGAFTVTGTSGNVVTITGNTSNLIYTGSGNVTGLDYLNIQGRAYGANGETTDIWYGGANSVNSGSLGWIFASGVTPPPSANSNFFLMFG